MNTRRNSTVIYVLALAVIIVAFLLLGGGPWIKGMMHGSPSMDMSNLNWPQILIGFGLGFLLGLIVSRYRRHW